MEGRDISHLPDVSNGKRMMVTNIAVDVPPMRARTSPSLLRQYNTHHGYLGGKALNMVVAQGPYTTRDSLEYAPLADLMMAIRASDPQPDVVFLMG